MGTASCEAKTYVSNGLQNYFSVAHMNTLLKFVPLPYNKLILW